MDKGEFDLELEYIERAVSYFRTKKELIIISSDAELIRSSRLVLEHVMFDYKALEKRAKGLYPDAYLDRGLD